MASILLAVICEFVISGPFLVSQAYAGRNNESAIHLLKLCEEDLRSALAEEGMSSKVLCQLGAIAGARGDVSRSSQDLPSAAAAYRESATWFEIVEEKDAEVGLLNLCVNGSSPTRQLQLRSRQSVLAIWLEQAGHFFQPGNAMDLRSCALLS
jgi:hypothetical protein